MWDQTSVIAVLVALMAVNTVGVVLVALQLPGTWLMVLTTALVTWWRWEAPGGPPVTAGTLAALVGLALLGELLEFLGGWVGSSHAGGSKRAGLLALVGGIAGAILGTVFIPIFVVGTIIGAALGAGACALAGERWAGAEWSAAWNVGHGAAIGRVLGSVSKLVVAVLMWLVALVAIVWP